MLRNIGRVIAFFILGMVILVMSVIAPVNYNVDTKPIIDIPNLKLENGNGVLKVGWSSINITPSYPLNMAGYGPRGPYESVADSLFSRVIIFDNGAKEVIMISLDLILFPRYVKDRIEQELSLQGITKHEIFFSATHTHNGFGNWEKSLGGQFAFGHFDEENVDELVSKILIGVELARLDKSPTKIGFEKIDAGELVMNRLSPEKGSEDPYIRVVQMQKTTGEIGTLISFSGHATNLDADIWQLSRDFPGQLVSALEADPEIDFAMFCAGMVGSHNVDIDIPKSTERIETVGKRLAKKIFAEMDSIDYDYISILGGADIQVQLPPSQLRISRNLHIRDWVFRFFLGALEANIKIVQVGCIVFIGMPCDYSGELSINNNLDELADKYDKKLFITSFNGNYVGYITEDNHYQSSNHDEVRVMNWVGPNMGDYFTKIIKLIITETN